MREMTADAPVMLDHLSDVAKQHFDTVLAHLDALGVPYVINPRMVRGLDYYTKTTFEFVHDGLGAQSGIGGGGRYDGLMRQLGGQDLSGIGFGLGVDRTVLALKAEGKTVGRHHARRRVRRAVGGAGQADAGGAGRAAAGRRCAGRPGLRRPRHQGRDARRGPVRAPRSRWSPATVTSRRARSGSKNLATGEQVDIASMPLSPRCFRASVGRMPNFPASDRVCTRHAVKWVQMRSLVRVATSSGELGNHGERDG